MLFVNFFLQNTKIRRFEALAAHGRMKHLVATLTSWGLPVADINDPSARDKSGGVCALLPE
jgi:hypothetical protein